MSIYPIHPITLGQLRRCSPQFFRQPRSNRMRASPLRKSPPQLLYIVPIKCRSLCHVVGPPALGTPYQLPRIVVTHVCRKLTFVP